MKLLTLFAWILPHAAIAAPFTQTGRVERVYDGDTVVMDNGDKVRVRWVNTPEKRPLQAYAEEAQRFTERLLLHRKVTLHMDDEKKRDGYGRLIAAISVGDVDLSLALVERGLAHVFIIPPEPSDTRALLDAQSAAKASRRGIWSTSRYRGTLHITSFHANAPGDDRDNLNGEYLRICNVSDAAIDFGLYSIKNASGKKWRLPAVEIPAGHTVTLHSGAGVSQAEPDHQLTAFVNSTQPIWSNEGDRATLLDMKGQTVDMEAYGNLR